MLDRPSRSIIARGDPRVLRDTSDIPTVKQFFNRSRPDHLPPRRDQKDIA
jgi:phospholipid/cholesterol/gamma-HCH transport system ATP-binding protein